MKTMRLTIAILLLFFCKFTFAQSIDIIDSLAIEMCESVKVNSNQTITNIDSILLENYINSFITNSQASDKDSLFLCIVLRLEKNCDEYSKIAFEQTENYGDWMMHTEQPISSLEKIDCDNFYDIERFSYLESTGDIVHLELKDGYWVDHFKDGTFSKLKLRKTNDCEFEIEFIESNNNIRKNFSKKGDKYIYQILTQNTRFYELSVQIPGKSIYYTFKLYYKRKFERG